MRPKKIRLNVRRTAPDPIRRLNADASKRMRLHFREYPGLLKDLRRAKVSWLGIIRELAEIEAIAQLPSTTSRPQRNLEWLRHVYPAKERRRTVLKIRCAARLLPYALDACEIVGGESLIPAKERDGFARLLQEIATRLGQISDEQCKPLVKTNLGRKAMPPLYQLAARALHNLMPGKYALIARTIEAAWLITMAPDRVRKLLQTASLRPR